MLYSSAESFSLSMHLHASMEYFWMSFQFLYRCAFQWFLKHFQVYCCGWLWMKKLYLQQTFRLILVSPCLSIYACLYREYVFQTRPSMKYKTKVNILSLGLHIFLWCALSLRRVVCLGHFALSKRDQVKRERGTPLMKCKRCMWNA